MSTVTEFYKLYDGEKCLITLCDTLVWPDILGQVHQLRGNEDYEEAVSLFNQATVSHRNNLLRALGLISDHRKVDVVAMNIVKSLMVALRLRKPQGQFRIVREV